MYRPLELGPKRRPRWVLASGARRYPLSGLYGARGMFFRIAPNAPCHRGGGERRPGHRQKIAHHRKSPPISSPNECKMWAAVLQLTQFSAYHHGQDASRDRDDLPLRRQLLCTREERIGPCGMIGISASLSKSRSACGADESLTLGCNARIRCHSNTPTRGEAGPIFLDGLDYSCDRQSV